MAPKNNFTDAEITYLENLFYQRFHEKECMSVECKMILDIMTKLGLDTESNFLRLDYENQFIYYMEEFDRRYGLK